MPKARSKKAAPAQKPQDKKVKRKAAQQNKEVGSGPIVRSKAQMGPNFKRRRKAGEPK